MKRQHDYASDEQLRYADWLEVGMRIGFGALALSFAIYATGIVPAGIAPADLPRYWSLSAAEYVAATGAPTGWAWVARLGESDLLNFVGVAILGTVTILCYARVLVLFMRRRERVFAAICAAEILVLVVAAAGVFGAGH
jgi:hypothetical protein